MDNERNDIIKFMWNRIRYFDTTRTLDRSKDCKKDRRL